MYEYNLGIVIVIGGILSIAIMSAILNHRKKTKSNQQSVLRVEEWGLSLLQDINKQ